MAACAGHALYFVDLSKQFFQGLSVFGPDLEQDGAIPGDSVDFFHFLKGTKFKNTTRACPVLCVYVNEGQQRSANLFTIQYSDGAFDDAFLFQTLRPFMYRGRREMH